MRRDFGRDDRGQAIVETAFFMPLLILALTAIIFFVRLGVLSERAESAVRYGDLVSFRNGQAYSVSAVSLLLNQVLYHNSANQLLDLCLSPATGPATPNPAPTGINGDIRAALSQTQVVNAAASAAPSPQPFFQADAISQPNCSPGSVNLSGNTPNGNSTYKYPVGDLPVNVDSFSITAKVGVPSYFAPVLMGNTCNLASSAPCSTTTADMAFINVAAPTTLLTCVPGLSIVLVIMNPLAANNPASCT